MNQNNDGVVILIYDRYKVREHFIRSQSTRKMSQFQICMHSLTIVLEWLKQILTELK